MDLIQDWALTLLNQTQTQDPATYASYYKTYAPYLWRLTTLLTTTKSHLLPLLTTLTQKPDLTTLALLLIILLLSLKLLNLLWQTVLFWFKLARTILFWGGLLVLGLWMWSRGPEGVVGDVGVWVGRWKEEYAVLKGREEGARLAQRAGGGGGGFGRPTQTQRGWF
ncbi:hypothetical protein LTR62_000419 [Meristemomyces frigidus]|uniref:Uncharacterized protein n=1 Tax=Meristemomyces frigidus TaxID=1508187 RepID=A0AAN7YIN8_9PEZI|nr:hypothetical protein LTR62_000419 [Meristemomyces frigidus]